MGCCCSVPHRERNRDTEMGWHNNDGSHSDPARELSESDPVETKLELEGAASSTLPAELESPVAAQRHHVSDMDDPPPYSPGNSQPVVVNRESRVSNESNRSIQRDIGRASEDSGFEKREPSDAPEGPGFDNRKYMGVVL